MNKIICYLKWGASALLLTLCLFSPLSLRAQEARGTLTGTVKDSTGAVVPNAQVKITNTARGTTTSLTTNDAGLYRAPYLIPGTYQITTEATGFKKSVRDNLELRVNDTLEINVQLEVGRAEDAVTITAEAPSLETSNASLGQVVDSRRIQELPIGHGDPYALSQSCREDERR